MPGFSSLEKELSDRFNEKTEFSAAATASMITVYNTWKQKHFSPGQVLISKRFYPFVDAMNLQTLTWTLESSDTYDIKAKYISGPIVSIQTIDMPEPRKYDCHNGKFVDHDPMIDCPSDTAVNAVSNVSRIDSFIPKELSVVTIPSNEWHLPPSTGFDCEPWQKTTLQNIAELLPFADGTWYIEPDFYFKIIKPLYLCVGGERLNSPPTFFGYPIKWMNKIHPWMRQRGCPIAFVSRDGVRCLELPPTKEELIHAYTLTPIPPRRMAAYSYIIYILLCILFVMFIGGSF